MRVLLSAVGTRGDVQPIVAVATKVRELGHEARLAVPPNFVEWVRGLGFEACAVGVEMRAPPPRAGGAATLTAEELRRMRGSMPDLIGDQFDAVGAAAEGCDAILGANAHQYAARSIAELLDIPCVNALYAPVALPSPDHAPPPAPGVPWSPGDAGANLGRWTESRRAWNERALDRVNANRTKRGLPAIDDVLLHNIGERPWLATDDRLAPIPSAPGMDVVSTGAWFLDDATPLPDELAAFLDRGESPIYFGFGSMPAPAGVSRAIVDAARATGHRAIVSRGWAELGVTDDAGECLVIGEVNHRLLFPRLAAIVHHGGAGTTHAAARAGVPQVVAPMFSDQFYWASRVRAVGIGSSLAGGLTSDALTEALAEALQPSKAARARDLAGALSADGAMTAARRLVSLG